MPKVAVEVRPATSPDGRLMVLVQHPGGYILMTPPDARKVAAMMLDAADEVDAEPSTGL